MEENKAMPAPGQPQKEKEFVDEMPHKYKRQIGKQVATSLAGFLAGAVVTSLVLIPWMYFLGKLCPSAFNDSRLMTPPQNATEEAPAAPAPTPAP